MTAAIKTTATRLRFSLLKPHPAHLLKRRAFAWLPVACHSTPTPFVSRIGWYWLTPVTLSMTFYDGWCAYADDNAGVPVRSDLVIDAAAVAAGLAACAAVAAALWPVAHKLPWPSF